MDVFVVLCGLHMDQSTFGYRPNIEYIITDGIARCEHLGKINGIDTFHLEHEVIELGNPNDARRLVHVCGPDLKGCKQSFADQQRHITAWTEE